MTKTTPNPPARNVDTATALAFTRKTNQKLPCVVANRRTAIYVETIVVIALIAMAQVLNGRTNTHLRIVEPWGFSSATRLLLQGGFNFMY